MQTNLKRLGLAVPSLVLALTTLVSVPVFAEHGSSSGSSDTQTATTSGSTSGSGSETETSTSGTETHNSTATETETESSLDVHQQGKDMVTALKKERKSSQTDAQRTQKCEAHKQGLTTKFDHIVTNSQSYQNKITDILNKAVAYQQANNVTVTNFDSLVASATAAQGAAADSITALQSVKPSLDCNNVSVAQDVATFKAAAEKTRTALKAYKTAVKAVLQALEAAKEPAKTTTGGTQ